MKGGEIMESDAMIQLISNVGFPIAAFCAMFYMCNTTIKENTKVISELSHLIRKEEEKDNV